MREKEWNKLTKSYYTEIPKAEKSIKGGFFLVWKNDQGNT